MNNAILKAELSIDVSHRIKALQAEFEQAAKNTIDAVVRQHFSDGRYGTPKGAGYLEIEKFVDDIFGTEQMQEKMKKIFDEKFESILTESLTKAIQHKTNREAFRRSSE